VTADRATDTGVTEIEALEAGDLATTLLILSATELLTLDRGIEADHQRSDTAFTGTPVSMSRVGATPPQELGYSPGIATTPSSVTDRRPPSRIESMIRGRDVGLFRQRAESEMMISQMWHEVSPREE